MQDLTAVYTERGPQNHAICIYLTFKLHDKCGFQVCVDPTSTCVQQYIITTGNKSVDNLKLLHSRVDSPLGLGVSSVGVQNVL